MPMSDDEFYKSLYGPSGKPKAPAARTPREQADDQDMATQAKEGVWQGLLNVPESLGQLAEKGIRQMKPDFKMPLHDRAAAFRNRVESSPAGIGGEIAGSVLPSFLPVIGEYSDLAMLARAAPLVTRAGMGAAQGLISRPVSSANAGDNEYFTQGMAGAALGAIGGQSLARFIPPHIGHWLYNLPAAAKHAVLQAMFRGAGRIPATTGATAAGALTPEPEPQK